MFGRPIFQKCLPLAVLDGSKLYTKNESDSHSCMLGRPIFQKFSAPAVLEGSNLHTKNGSESIVLHGPP